MRSSKSRSRSKSNRPRTMGNIINRVFDSSGPEGKVRGTPQQIIEKYLFLARDAQLSNDRVAAENFLQHAEHYTRMLGEAQRELAAEQEARQQQHQGQNHNGGHGRDRREDRGDYRDQQRPEPRQEERFQERQPDLGEQPQPDLIDLAGAADEESILVETPEARTRPVHRREPREPREPRQPRAEAPVAPPAEAEGQPAPKPARPAKAAAQPAAEPAEAASEEPKADRGPRRPRGPRKPKGDQPGPDEGGTPPGDGPREAAE